MSPENSRSVRSILTSVRARALLVLAVFAAMAASGGLSTPLLVVAALLGAMALAVVVDPAVRGHWAFNVLAGVGVVLYGVAYALGQSTTAGLVVAVVIVVVGLFVAVSNLAAVPRSDRARGG